MKKPERTCEDMKDCVNIRKDAKFAFFQKKWRVGNVFLDSLGKWTYKSPVFLGENQEFSIFWPKNRAFFPITTGTYKSISPDWKRVGSNLNQ